MPPATSGARPLPPSDGREPDAPPVVLIERLVKRYRARPAVNGPSIAVGRGEVYGLIGPDAAGKSSMMKIIAGVLTHDGGDVRVLGIPVTSERSAEAIKGRIGFMPQGLGL